MQALEVSLHISTSPRDQCLDGSHSDTFNISLRECEKDNRITFILSISISYCTPSSTSIGMPKGNSTYQGHRSWETATIEVQKLLELAHQRCDFFPCPRGFYWDFWGWVWVCVFSFFFFWLFYLNLPSSSLICSFLQDHDHV